MTIEQSYLVHENWRHASDKFDYFVLGITGALCAYISQAYEPSKLAINASTLELLALTLLVCSAVAGFKRVEKIVMITKLHYQFLRTNQEHGVLIVSSSGAIVNADSGEFFAPEMTNSEVLGKPKALPLLATQINNLVKKSERSSSARNWLLLVGFIMLLTSKLWVAYE